MTPHLCCKEPVAAPVEYPPLDATTREVVKKMAKGLCVSYYSLAWAYYDDDEKRWEKLRKVLLSPPVRLVKDDDATV